MLFLCCTPAWGLLFTSLLTTVKEVLLSKWKRSAHLHAIPQKEVFSQSFQALMQAAITCPRTHPGGFCFFVCVCFFLLIAWQREQGLYHPSCSMSLPIPSPGAASLKEGPDAHQTKDSAAEGALRSGHRGLSNCRGPSHPGLKAESLCPAISKQAGTVWAAGSRSTNHP